MGACLGGDDEEEEAEEKEEVVVDEVGRRVELQALDVLRRAEERMNHACRTCQLPTHPTLTSQLRLEHPCITNLASSSRLPSQCSRPGGGGGRR